MNIKNLTFILALIFNLIFAEQIILQNGLDNYDGCYDLSIYNSDATKNHCTTDWGMIALPDQTDLVSAKYKC